MDYTKLPGMQPINGAQQNSPALTNLGAQQTTSMSQFAQPGLQPINGINSGGLNFLQFGTPAPAKPNTANEGNTLAAYDYAAADRAKEAATNQQNIDLVRAGFGAQRANLNAQMGAIDPARQASELRAQNQYTNQFNSLKTGLAQGQRNLGYSRDSVNEQKERSLKALRDQLMQQSQSYSNQLGTYGAGDSSAAGMINFALAGQASRNRGDVMGSASAQNNEINMQELDLNTAFEQNKKSLDDWKQGTLSDIVSSFADQKAKIQNALATADYEEAQQLAQYDASLTQNAISRLAQLEQQYTQQGQELANRYKNMFAPQNIQIDPSLQQYQVKDITPGQIKGLTMPTAVNPEAEAIAIARRREEDQLLANPLGL